MRPANLDDDIDEPPLDPVLERVQARLRRLMLIAGSTLLFGLLAVAFAIVYRVSNLERHKGPWSVTADIPAGHTVLDTAVDGGRLAVTVDGPDGRKVLVFDLETGRRLGETAIVAR